MYVNWARRKLQGYIEERLFEHTHQGLPRFPPKLLAQELDHGLKSVRNGHSEKVLFHYGRVPDRFEAHDHCQRVFKFTLLLANNSRFLWY
jgi:hypothetical protein